MENSIDTERLQDAWEQIIRFEDYSNNTELYSYIKSIKDAKTAIGDPTPAMLDQLTDEQRSQVLAVCEVYSKLADAAEKGQLPPGIW